MKKVQMAARIPQDVKDELLKLSKEQKRSMSNLMTMAIEQFLERNRKYVNFLEE